MVGVLPPSQRPFFVNGKSVLSQTEELGDGAARARSAIQLLATKDLFSDGQNLLFSLQDVVLSELFSLHE
jgi:hypothetical protein